MENTKTQRLSDRGLLLTAKETAFLQEHGYLKLDIPLREESAYYSFAFLEWLTLPQGAVKIALPTPQNSIWLKASSILFRFHSYYQYIRVPSSVFVCISNEVFVR